MSDGDRERHTAVLGRDLEAGLRQLRAVLDEDREATETEGPSVNDDWLALIVAVRDAVRLLERARAEMERLEVEGHHWAQKVLRAERGA